MTTQELQAKRRKQSLDELECVKWGPPTYDSYLVTTCHRLRTKPIGEFSIEDLRIMIGQKIGLFFLVPLALEAVERDPMAEGDYYPGDLLSNLLAVPDDFWHIHKDWKSRLDEVVRRLPDNVEIIADEVAQYRQRSAQQGTPALDDK